MRKSEGWNRKIL